MSGVISTPITQGVTLTVNPTTITDTGSVTTASGIAVTGPVAGAPITGWTLTNEGSVTASAAGANGVDLASGGSVANAGLISGYQNGVDITAGVATVTNTGTIESSPTKIVASSPSNYYDGVYLGAGGSVTNTGSGTIFGSISGIDIAGGSGTVSNTGTILTTTLQGNGVALEDGGTVINSGTGSLYGDFSGVSVYGAAGFITNSAAIGAVGLNGYGVYLGAGGTITNTGSGSIIGSYTGVAAASGITATLSTAGYVYGADTGVNFQGGGLITNLAGGAILAVTTAVVMDGGTVINAGTIESTATGGTAVSFGAGQQNDLVVEAGAAFIGAVTGGGADSVLELGSEPTGTMGALAGIGSQITGFDTIAFDGGDSWSLSGSLAGFGGELVTGFATGDSIVLDGATGLTSSYNTATGDLTLTSGATTETIQFEGLVGNAPELETVGANTAIFVPCFAAGTRIATPDGERLVELLQPGDEVLTILGEVLPIIWVGRREIDCAAHPQPDRVRPVRIAAHAFAPGVPHRDLLLSPDHAILAHGVLIPAKQLINGMTICQTGDTVVTYHHIELPRHAVMVANGLAAESYLDTGDRPTLGLNAGAQRLVLFSRSGPEAQLVRDALACAPIRILGPEVEAVRRRLAKRAAMVLGVAEERAA